MRVREVLYFALVASGIGLLFSAISLNQERRDSIRDTEEIVGYEAPWVHPAGIMKRSAEPQTRGS